MRPGSLPQLRQDFFLRVKKVGRVIMRPTQVFPQALADVGDALLDLRLGGGRWLRWELKHGRCLTLAQERQQHGSPIRKFERIVMGGRRLLVDFSKDRRLVVDRLCLPTEQTNRQARYFPGEG
jgi:hypothetical protein